MDSGKAYASCCALWARVLVLALKLALSGLLPATVVELTVSLLQYLVKCKSGSLLKHCAYIQQIINRIRRQITQQLFVTLAVFSLQPSYFLLPSLWDYRYSSGQTLSWYVPKRIPTESSETYSCVFLGVARCVPGLGECQEIIHRRQNQHREKCFLRGFVLFFKQVRDDYDKNPVLTHECNPTPE